jgi:hypothetical protein
MAVANASLPERSLGYLRQRPGGKRVPAGPE